ncbi:MAG: GFA family protein [Pseudomonadota bacterium]
MSNLHAGSCLCGAVRFEVDGEFERFYLCHCEHCRKDTGSAHAANLFSSQVTLKWIAGQDKVVFFNLPSTRHSKSFCSICGSALPSAQADGKLVVVPAGSLDSVVTNKPDAHLFMSSKAGWDNCLEGIPKMEKYPS